MWLISVLSVHISKEGCFIAYIERGGDTTADDPLSRKPFPRIYRDI